MRRTALMPMPLRMSGTVAPYARVRVPWQASQAAVSSGLGLGFGSFVCVTGGDNQTTEIDTKAHGTCRLPETST